MGLIKGDARGLDYGSYQIFPIVVSYNILGVSNIGWGGGFNIRGGD